jgi:hypothetical protein
MRIEKNSGNILETNTMLYRFFSMRAEASTGLDLLVNFYQEKLTKNPKRAPELHLKNTETRFDILKAALKQSSEDLIRLSIDIEKLLFTRLLIMILSKKQSNISRMLKGIKI